MTSARGRLEHLPTATDAFLTLLADDMLLRLHLTEDFRQAFSTTLHNVINGMELVIHNVAIDGAELIPLSNALLVVEPNILVDVTDVAECFLAHTPLPAALPLLRSSQQRPTESMVIGTLINAMVDALVVQPSLDDDDVFRLAALQRPLQMALVASDDATWQRITELARKTLPSIRDGLRLWDNRTVHAEPTFLSPALGLQGRLDFVLRSAEDPRLMDIVELKSGTPPTPTPHEPHATRPSHRAQAVAYDMMLRLGNPGRTGSTSVWYPRTDATPFRSITPTSTTEMAIIDCRNALVLQQMGSARRSPQFLASFKRHVAMQLPDYARNDAMDVATAIENLSPMERLYLRAWSSFLHNETLHTLHGEGGTAELWTTSIGDKRAAEGCLTDLSFDEGGSDLASAHVRYRRHQHDSKDSSLRHGDPVVVLRHSDASAEAIAASPVLKGTIRDVTTDFVDVSLRNKLVDVHHITHAQTRWIVEREATVGMLKPLVGNLARWALTPTAKRQTLLGLREPRRSPQQTIDPKGLYPQQCSVVSQALAAQDWFLIQGPPGTGKTSAVLRRLVDALHADGQERLLLLAYTNRAADEICSVVERTIGSEAYIRLASKDGAGRQSAQRHLSALASQLTPVSLAQEIAACRCFVATIASMNTNAAMLSAMAPTTVIVDEASQVLEPNLLPIATAAGRLILIGDECQLPAVIAQDSKALATDNAQLHEICLDSLGQSYFERLMRCAVLRGWQHSIGRLTEQGRMHNRIGSVVGSLFYGGTLSVTQPWQSNATAWHGGSPIPLLHEIFSKRLVFIDTHSPVGSDAILEARLAARIATLIAGELGLANASAIGIISPFRSQNFRIRSLLPTTVQSSITVDTVERFQGSEREVMIVAASVGSVAELEGITSVTQSVNGSVDRKLNVAISRARECCIIIGNSSILAASPSWAALMDSCESVSLQHLSEVLQRLSS
jgi:DNA replication ATP-dependent helicase Dna2